MSFAEVVDSSGYKILLLKIADLQAQNGHNGMRCELVDWLFSKYKMGLKWYKCSIFCCGLPGTSSRAP